MMTTYELVIKTLFAFLLCFSLSAQRTAMVGVLGTTTEAATPPADTTGLDDLASRADILILPDSAKNSSGNLVSSGDEVYQFDDYNGNYSLTDRSTRPTQTLHFDTIPYFWNNPNWDPMPFVTHNNQQDAQWFDNTIAAGDTAPFEYYFVLMPFQTALNEKYYNGAFTIEDNNNSYLSTRYNGGSEVNWQSSGGTWIPPFNKVVIWHQIIKRSGYTTLEIDTGGGFVAYGDSVQLPSLAGTKMTNLQFGTNTRGASFRFYCMVGNVAALWSESDRTYIESVLNDEFTPGAYPVGARMSNGNWSFNSSNKVFTLTWDHATTGGGIDSVNIKVHWEDESYAPGNWVDGLRERFDTTNTTAAFGDANGGTFTFDRDDYADLSAGTQSEYIKAWMRFYDSTYGWSDWFETTFIINNTA